MLNFTIVRVLALIDNIGYILIGMAINLRLSNNVSDGVMALKYGGVGVLALALSSLLGALNAKLDKESDKKIEKEKKR